MSISSSSFVTCARQPLHQPSAVLRQIGDSVARALERAQDLDRRGRRVESDAVAEPPVRCRIVGEHERDAALGCRRAREPDPARRELGDEARAVRLDLILDHVDLGARAAPRRPLKLTARVMMRPSVSGSTTLIARSRGERPLVPSRQSATLPPLVITCSIGRSRPSAPDREPVPLEARDREAGRVEHDLRLAPRGAALRPRSGTLAP